MVRKCSEMSGYKILGLQMDVIKLVVNSCARLLFQVFVCYLQIKPTTGSLKE